MKRYRNILLGMIVICLLLSAAGGGVIPSVSAADDEIRETIPVENRSSLHYREDLLTATLNYRYESSFRTAKPVKLIIRDLPLKNEKIFDSAFYAENFDHYFGLKFEAVTADGQVEDFASGEVTIPIPQDWDLSSSDIMYDSPSNTWWARRLTGEYEVNCLTYVSGIPCMKMMWQSTYANSELLVGNSNHSSSYIGRIGNTAVCILRPVSTRRIEIPEGIEEISLRLIDAMGYTEYLPAEYPEKLTLVIPKTVKKIGVCELNYDDFATISDEQWEKEMIFWGETSPVYTLALAFHFDVAEDNPYFTDYQGNLYSKDLTKLIAGSPVSVKNASGEWIEKLPEFPRGIKTFGRYALSPGGAGGAVTYFYDSGVTSFRVPDTVEVIEDGALCQFGVIQDIVLPPSVRSLGKGCIYNKRFNLELQSEPSRVTVLNPNAVFADRAVVTDVIRGYRGSTAEAYVHRFNANPRMDDPTIIFEAIDDAPQTVVPVSIPELTPAADTPDNGRRAYLFRLYQPKTGEHFFTANIYEKDVLERSWVFEGVSCYQPENGIPVYRLYNPNNGEHHFTMDNHERSVLVYYGWRDEGVGWRSGDSSGAPVYRLYNPNKNGVGAHHYTGNPAERNHLMASGWRSEGVGWYE